LILSSGTSSPDLNPSNILFGGALQQLVYHQKIEDVDDVKQVLNICWDMISQQLIDVAIEQWSKRPSSVVRSRRGHIEHRFSYFWKLILE